MNLIDIVKLNEEINKMIEKQDEEVKRINTDIEREKESLYRAFMDDMEEYSKTAEAISPALRVFVGSHDDGYGNRKCVDVEFATKPHRLLIRRMTTLGDTFYTTSIGYSQPYNEAIVFGSEKIINSIVKWYFDHPREFENYFKDECLRTIKENVEKANKRMLDAEERKRSYESGETK